MLTNQWITGFVDGEGCFHISILRNKEMRYGIQILPEFTITQHINDIQLLMKIKKYFDCGVVRCNKKQGSNIYCYRVRSLEHANSIIVPFFEKNILQTRKLIDFQRYRYIVMYMYEGRHLTESGLEEILKYIDGGIKIKSKP